MNVFLLYECWSDETAIPIKTVARAGFTRKEQAIYSCNNDGGTCSRNKGNVYLVRNKVWKAEDRIDHASLPEDILQYTILKIDTRFLSLHPKLFWKLADYNFYGRTCLPNWCFGLIMSVFFNEFPFVEQDSHTPSNMSVASLPPLQQSHISMSWVSFGKLLAPFGQFALYTRNRSSDVECNDVSW